MVKGRIDSNRFLKKGYYKLFYTSNPQKYIKLLDENYISYSILDHNYNIFLIEIPDDDSKLRELFKGSPDYRFQIIEDFIKYIDILTEMNFIINDIVLFEESLEDIIISYEMKDILDALKSKNSVILEVSCSNSIYNLKLYRSGFLFMSPPNLGYITGILNKIGRES